MSPTALTPLPPPVIPKMDPEKKGWWVEALNSERFRKGKGALRERHDDGLTYHCCLGVLCEVAIEHGLDLELATGPDGQTYFDNEALLLPGKVMEWAGLTKNGPEVWNENGDGGRYKCELTLINDDTEDTLADIAVRIERDL